jgi:hypothetical protein
MNLDLRCRHCGEIISSAGTPGLGNKCAHCGLDIMPPQSAFNLHHPATPAKTASKALTKSMPWLISVAFHLGLVIILALVTMMASGAGTLANETVITNAKFSPDLGGTITPSKMGLANDVASAAPGRVEFHKAQASIDSGESSKGNISVAGIAGPAGGSDAGGNLAMPSAGGGGDPGFFGRRSGGISVRHVVYVIDRSGSMLDTFDNLRAELVTSISHLKPNQEFHIIFFSQGPAIENPPGRLIQASDEQKASAVEFLSTVTASSKTDPLPALRRAFDVLDKAALDETGKPDKLIYLLTDGVFPDNGAVFQLLHERNARKNVHISTFNYGSRSPVAIQVLKQIAEDYGGNYTYLDMDQ